MTNDTARARLVATRYVRDPRPRIHVRVAPITHPPEADMTVTFLPSPYFTASRAGAKITDIVVHWMVTTLAGADAEFQYGSRHVSAHYGIEGTTVHQYVHEQDTAWHAGDHAENIRSIGIEHSAAPGRDASPATVATSIALIVTLARKYNISPDHIYPHNKFYPTACPGTLPVASIIAAVRKQLTPPKGIFMALTDAQQAALLADVSDIKDRLYGIFPQRFMTVTDGVATSVPATTAGAVPARGLDQLDGNVLLRTQPDSAVIAKAVVALLPAGGATAAQIAKAVNDDAAKRLVT